MGGGGEAALGNEASQDVSESFLVNLGDISGAPVGGLSASTQYEDVPTRRLSLVCPLLLTLEVLEKRFSPELQVMRQSKLVL